MLLTIDVGNTNMVFGIYEGDRLVSSFRLKTDASRTADEIGLLATRYFAQFGLDANGVELFADEGRAAFTMLCFPETPYDRIQIQGQAQVFQRQYWG